MYWLSYVGLPKNEYINLSKKEILNPSINQLTYCRLRIYLTRQAGAAWILPSGYLSVFRD